MKNFFEKLVNPFPDINPNQESPPNNLWGFIRYHCRGYEKVFSALAVLEVFSAICEVSIYAFVGKLVDWLMNHNRETFLQDELYTLLGYSALLLIAMPIINFTMTSLRTRSINSNLPMAVRWRSHRRLLAQSMDFYQDEFAGRVSTKVMQSSIAVREIVVIMISVLMYVSVYFGSMLFVLFTLNSTLLIPMLIWLAVYIGLQVFFTPKIGSIAKKFADSRSHVTGRIVDAYTNINTVKLFAHTDSEADYAKDSMQELLKDQQELNKVSAYMLIAIMMLNYVLLFTISSLGIYLWLGDMVTAGAIAVAITMALRLLGMSQWIMYEMSTLFENIGTLIDGINMLSKPQTLTDKHNADKLIISGGQIDFQQTTFTYRKNSQEEYADKDSSAREDEVMVFNNLNLNIKAGEKIGLVGRSGAGKSTLVNLLLRFYDINSGTICIDGQDIRQVQQDSLRQHIAMVTQDTSLLHRTVRENILYGRPNASDDELMTAIKQAKADEFIFELTDPNGNMGLDAQVGERGVKLSGGQRQRIAIARVLLKNAPILILDEATSALDSEVESAIQESLEELMEGKTVIAIAHRLSTIASLDRLVVMDKGHIIEQGSHQELIDKKGVYANLWEHQTGGFLGE